MVVTLGKRFFGTAQLLGEKPQLLRLGGGGCRAVFMFFLQSLVEIGVAALEIGETGLLFSLGFRLRILVAHLTGSSGILLRLPPEKVEPGVEEDVEFFHLHTENTREDEMAKFMYYHENGESEDKLESFYKEYCHFLNS